MAVDFFLAMRYRMAVGVEDGTIDGTLLLPSGLAFHTLLRRKLGKHSHLQRRLFDPQIYLVHLNPATCAETCINLSSYPYMPLNAQAGFDSAEQKQSEWKRDRRSSIRADWSGQLPEDPDGIDRLVASCFDVQQKLGCEDLITPAPLTEDPNSDLAVELRWLDAALKWPNPSGKRRLATIALSEVVLRAAEPDSNELITLILDQVTAREPEGVYIVLEQSLDSRYYIANPRTLGGFLRLIRGFRAAGVSRVVVSFAGVAGLLALAAGADTWCSGWYRGQRRLSMPAMEDQFGLAVPTYYCHALASEIHLEQDLDTLVGKGMLEDLKDLTPASEPLMAALAAGRLASSVPEWKHSPSNTTAAIDHFLAAAGRETARLRALTEPERIEHVRRWTAQANDLANRVLPLGRFNQRTELGHQAAWVSAFLAATQ